MPTPTIPAGSTATLATLTNLTRTYYEPALLDRAISRMYHCNLAQPSTIPTQGGSSVNWRKFSALAAALTPIQSGVTPESAGFGVTDLSATPLQYGSYIRHSDVLVLEAFDNVTSEFSEMLGEQAGLTADTLCRDLMATGGTVQYASTAEARDEITSDMTLKGVEITEGWATLISAGAVGWDFLEGRFAAVCSAFAWEDLIHSSDFRDAALEALPRSDQHPFFAGEVFDYMRCRFFVTAQAKVFPGEGASNIDVYATMIIARGAFGIAGIGDHWIRTELGMGGTESPPMPVTLINQELGSEGSADPLKQRATIGWSGFQEERELDSTWAVRIEHAI